MVGGGDGKLCFKIPRPKSKAQCVLSHADLGAEVGAQGHDVVEVDVANYCFPNCITFEEVLVEKEPTAKHDHPDLPQDKAELLHHHLDGAQSHDCSCAPGVFSCCSCC